MGIGRALVVLLAAVSVVAGGARAQAQGLSGCNATRLSPPPRVAYRCAGGLLVEVEAAGALRLVAAEADGRPGLVEVQGGAAVLIETEVRRTRFQILTPHAIASVRGTVFLVDVTAGGTAVFVSEGRVQVSRRDGSAAVALDPGEGVDVAPGEPLVVKRWGAGRVEALFDRFGR